MGACQQGPLGGVVLPSMHTTKVRIHQSSYQYQARLSVVKGFADSEGSLRLKLQAGRHVTRCPADSMPQQSLYASQVRAGT